MPVQVAGTEQGITEPEATFSACFGGAFLLWHPMKYASMLAEKMDEHGTNAWLVNTGWTGGRSVTPTCMFLLPSPRVTHCYMGLLSESLGALQPFGYTACQRPLSVILFVIGNTVVAAEH